MPNPTENIVASLFTLQHTNIRTCTLPNFKAAKTFSLFPEPFLSLHFFSACHFHPLTFPKHFPWYSRCLLELLYLIMQFNFIVIFLSLLVCSIRVKFPFFFFFTHSMSITSLVHSHFITLFFFRLFLPSEQFQSNRLASL